MNHFLKIGMAVAASVGALQASAVTINFDNLPVGATLSNQYAALGVIFTPNAFSGAGAPVGLGWATNTDMTIVSVDGDVGSLGLPSLASGNLLHSLSKSTPDDEGLGGEDGVPSFRISFSSAATFVSADVVSVLSPSRVHMWVYDGETLIADVRNNLITGQYTLSYSGAPFTSVVINPGTPMDWVGVDNINFTLAAPVPEPQTCALMGTGLAMLGLARRRKRVL